MHGCYFKCLFEVQGSNVASGNELNITKQGCQRDVLACLFSRNVDIWNKLPIL